MKDFNLEKAKEVINRPLQKDKIKQRQGSFGMKLDYIEGATVIELLNEAFDYIWSFEILGAEKIESEKKWNKSKKQFEDQPPYMRVHARLTIPQLNVVKEQFGTKIYLGGATEQEGAAKSAATDALKKCATLLGVGLELYEDKGSSSSSNDYSKNNVRTYSQNNTTRKVTTKTPEPPKQTKDYDEDEVRKLGELKVILGIDSNPKLDPFVAEFTGEKNATYKNVTPDNIKAFNKFLEKKTEGI